MSTIKRTVRDSSGNLIYQVLQEHCSHASAAGSFQVIKKGSLINTKLSGKNSTTVNFEGDSYLFEDVQ